jgi:peptide/nickel transport system permease protein
MLFQSAKRNARVFLKSKLGVAGTAIILFFLILAIFAPLLTNNDPIFGINISSPYSVPDWASIFPHYHGLTPTLFPVKAGEFSSQGDLSHWAVSGANASVAVVANGLSLHNGSQGALMVNQSFVPNPGAIANPLVPGQPLFMMSQSFTYSYKPPTTFIVNALVRPLVMSNVSVLYVNFILSSPAHNYSLGSVNSFTIRSQIVFSPANLEQTRNIIITSGLLPSSGNPDFPITSDPAGRVFSTNGTYQFSLQILAVGSGTRASYSVAVGGVSFQIVGRTYGLLGTDVYGRDIWAQFVWGSQISILVGVFSAIGSVVIGTLAGLAAGLIGGWVDEVISRVTDFFLVIPFLPLAIVVIFFLGQNPVLFKGIYYWVILLFVALSWPTITRIVRSQVLIVKEKQFVEASRALGGRSRHIMIRHILPNVLGLVYAQTALLVPGFILTEAALDFLAVAVHPISTITWGIMLTEALANAALTNAAADYAWWWFLPPGIAIALLSLAFVMVGYALDNVFNPKLRHR